VIKSPHPIGEIERRRADYEDTTDSD